MQESLFHTAQLQDWLGRIQRRDEQARNELAAAIGQRVERLARGMLRGFDNIRRDADTLDIAQVALLRVLSALDEPGRHFDSTRQFLAFAATCIRSELLDVARRCGSAKRGGGKVVSQEAARPSADASAAGPIEPAAPREADEELELWTRFHEQVANLPAEEREVVGLKFYHGWTEKEIAALFQVTDRTVRRWWVSACVKLEKALGGEMPTT